MPSAGRSSSPEQGPSGARVQSPPLPPPCCKEATDSWFRQHDLGCPNRTGNLPLRFVVDMSGDDHRLLVRLLTWMTDHGGGRGPLPDCYQTSCASCQAIHLLKVVTGP